MTAPSSDSPPRTPPRDVQRDLAQAVVQYRLQDARDALARGAHPDGAAATTDRPGTPSDSGELLVFALEHRHEPMVQLLVAHGANVTRTRSNGEAPIHLAAKSGLLSSLTLLLSRGADPCAVTGYGASALEIAIRARRVAVVEYLLRTVPALREARASDPGAGPLHRAAEARSRPIVRLALQYGGRWDAVDAEGWSPLQRAVRAGADGAFIRFVVAQGASVHARTPVGAPIDVAVREGDVRALGGLIDAGAVWTAETTAALDQLPEYRHEWVLGWLVTQVAARRLNPEGLSSLLTSRVAATRAQALFLVAGPSGGSPVRTVAAGPSGAARWPLASRR